ncbi:MAG: hypothetical protein KatS3mg110_0490 [Pirellulaceae bacterium]|nr:MAG: hypothetical protein KatS3mg110_0490 [Pirellulaceae bacterium]
MNDLLVRRRLLVLVSSGIAGSPTGSRDRLRKESRKPLLDTPPVLFLLVLDADAAFLARVRRVFDASRL